MVVREGGIFAVEIHRAVHVGGHRGRGNVSGGVGRKVPHRVISRGSGDAAYAHRDACSNIGAGKGSGGVSVTRIGAHRGTVVAEGHTRGGRAVIDLVYA